METSTAGVTVKPVMPVMVPEVAMMVVLPVPAPVASPPVAMVAAAVFVELHTTKPVRLPMLPSLYIPVAVYCWVVPLAMEALIGVTEMDTSTAVTVRLVEPVTAPDTAWMEVVPTPMPVASPPLVIVAAAVLVELQVTEAVRFVVLPSL